MFNLYDREEVITPPPGYDNAEIVFGSAYKDQQLTLKPLSCEFMVINLD